MQPAASATRRIRLWDGPTRLFHWLLLLAVTTSITTAQLGGNWMELHGKAGLCVGGLLVFRLVWGFAGNRYARFASFMPTPAKLRSYLRGNWQGLGHNPLGALSVLAFLLLLSLQVGSGLFSNDDISFQGPWAASVSEELSGWLTGKHHAMATVLYVLLGLHIAAIFFHRLVRRDDLVRPMLTGYKNVDALHAADDAGTAGWPAFLLALVLALAAVWVLSGAALPGRAQAPAATAPAPANPAKPPAW
jgi:cytochrome b